MDALKSITTAGGGTAQAPSDIGALTSILGMGTGGFGAISNIINAMKQAGLTGDLRSQLNQLMKLSSNPTLLAQKAQALEQPLSQNLLNNVGNNTQAILAEKGLSSSPSQAQQITSQAIAPYQLNEQQQAEKMLMESLGLPFQGTSAVKYPQINTSSLWQQFLPKPAQSPFNPGINQPPKSTISPGLDLSGTPTGTPGVYDSWTAGPGFATSGDPGMGGQ